MKLSKLKLFVCLIQNEGDYRIEGVYYKREDATRRGLRCCYDSIMSATSYAASPIKYYVIEQSYRGCRVEALIKRITSSWFTKRIKPMEVIVAYDFKDARVLGIYANKDAAYYGVVRKLGHRFDLTVALLKFKVKGVSPSIL